MADYDYSNPFIMIDTPETNYLRREADIAKRYDTQGFWVGEAARAGSKLRRELNRAGIAMGRGDEVALNNQSAIEQIQMDLAEEVANGSVEPEEAQKIAVQRTMQAFMENGDYQSAASLKPALDAILAKELERNKLRSEAIENAADTRYKDAQTKQIEELLPLKADVQRSIAEKNRRAGKEGEDTEMLKSTRDGYRKVFMGSVQALARMTDIKQILVGPNAAAASDPASMVGSIQNSLVGAGMTAKNLFGLIPNVEDQQASVSVQERRAGDVENAAGKAARTLNSDVGVMQSLIMDLAYSLAKARDPGGRLSDADVDNAIRIIGVAGDPQRMRDVIDDIAKRTYEDRKREMRAEKSLQEDWFSGYRSELDDAWNSFYSVGRPKDSQPGKGVGPSTVGAGAPPAVGEWSQPMQAPDGSTVRVRILTGNQ